MVSVPSVAGPRDNTELGRVLMHEHVFVLNHEYEINYPESWNHEERITDAVDKLDALKAKGIDTIVDLTVLGLGRDIGRVREVAQRTEMTIIAATGFYTFNELPTYLRLRGPGRLIEAEEPMVDMFVRDLTRGIGGTDVRAAILKCATDIPGITPDVERVLRAVARAHRETGAPISTHTDPNLQRGLEQQKIFTQEGVDLTRVIIGHSGDTDNLDYLQALLDNGSYLGMDRFGLDSRLPFERRVQTVVDLVQRGYADRLVLSHDTSCHSDNFPTDYRTANLPNWRFGHISDDVLPALRARGVTEAQIETMLVDTPRAIFATVPQP